MLVTLNIRDFAPLLQEWAGAGRSHSGCVLVAGQTHRQIGEIVKRLTALLSVPTDWNDRVVFLTADVS
jgi:hypothetical protein